MPFITDKYIGIPYVDGGRDFSGADCLGVIRLFYKTEYGIDIQDVAISCVEHEAIDRRIEEERASWRSVKLPTTPCVVVLKLDRHHMDWCTHLGVHIGDGWMLHTAKGKDCLRIRIDHPFYKNRVEGFYEYIN